MESAFLALTAFLANALLCGLQYAVQQLDLQQHRIAPRSAIIPGTRQQFLHWQDFSTMTWGDIVGLGLFWAGVIHLFGDFGYVQWLLFLTAATAGTTIFHQLWMSTDHKPDWAYPATGRVSRAGLVHLVYFGASIGAAVTGSLMTFTGQVIDPIVLTLGWGGAAIWASAVARDIWLGRVKKIDKEEQPR